MRMMLEGCWEETLLWMWEHGLNFLLHCYKSLLNCCCWCCTSLAWASTFKDCLRIRICWLLWALGDLWVLISFAAWCCCCMFCISCKYCKYLKNVPWSHLLISSLCQRGALHHWMAESLLSYFVLYGCLLSDVVVMGLTTQVGADDTLCRSCSPRVTDNRIMGFLVLGA